MALKELNVARDSVKLLPAGGSGARFAALEAKGLDATLLPYGEALVAGIMRAERRKRPVRRSLDHPDRRVFLFDSSAHRLDIIDLNAEMIESAGITGPSPQKCQADIAVVLE